MKIIAATDKPSLIAKIMARLGLPTSYVRCAIPASPAVQSSLPVAYRSLLNRSSPISLATRGILFIPNSLIQFHQPLQSGSVLIGPDSMAATFGNS